jgi:hypothetical protein
MHTYFTLENKTKSANQNNGLWIDACYEQNRKMDTYYGIIEEIWVLEYGELKVPLFQCKWVRPKAISLNKDGVTTIDLNSMGYREEHFVWAKDVVQVFYSPDLENNKGRQIILQGKRKIIGVDNTTKEEVNVY